MNKPLISNSTAVLAPGSVLSRVVIVLLLTATVVGCSSIRNVFGGKKNKATQPTELIKISPSVNVQQLWSATVGKGEGKLGVRQAPVVADGKVYAAAIRGGVHAFDLETGKQQWVHESDLRLSGGPGAGDGLVVVGSLDGVVLALDASTGAEKWRAEVSNEVIAAPVIGQGKVFVRSNDGVVTAFDAATGERRWFWNHEVPTLSVRGNDGVAQGPGLVFVGNDDGRINALVANDGRPLWDQAVGQQDGRTELDRMADIDGTPVLDDTTLYASSFKRQTMAIDAPSGRPLWAADHGGAGRVGVASDRLVVSDPDGVVYGLDKSGGSALWSQPGLKNRKVTGAAIQGDYAVVGDYDGYLHWLKLDNGEFAARERMGGDPLRAAPVVVDGILLMQNTDGKLVAFRLGQ